MIFASILGLEMLGWQTRLTVAVPYSIRKEAFQWHLLDRSVASSRSNSPFTAAFEHRATESTDIAVFVYELLPSLHLKLRQAGVRARHM